MGLLTPKGKKNDKKSTSPNAKNSIQGSKFFSNKNVKSSGSPVRKGMMTGGSQRGS